MHCCPITNPCVTLCDPMNFSMPGSSILHYFMEFVQIHVHWVGGAIQPSLGAGRGLSGQMTSLALPRWYLMGWFEIPFLQLNISLGFHDSSVGKESACNAGNPGLIPGSGRSTGEGIGYPLQYSWVSLVTKVVKNPSAMWETWVRSSGWEDPLEKGKATHSSILA